jgi:hypothetical protein
VPRQALRLAPLLAAAAVAGYLLGGCAGGSGELPGLSGVTLPTGTLPDITLPGPPTLPTPTEPEPATTEESPTTPEPETTTVGETVPTEPEPAPTSDTDTVPTETAEDENDGLLGWFALVLAAFRGEATTGETPTTTSVDTVPVETTAAEPEQPEDDTPWGWILLAAGLGIAAVVLAVLLWRRRRAGPGP